MLIVCVCAGEFTDKAIAEGLSKLEYLPCEGAKVKKLRQRPGSKHSCPQQVVDRGEKVETLHAAQGGYMLLSALMCS